MKIGVKSFNKKAQATRSRVPQRASCKPADSRPLGQCRGMTAQNQLTLERMASVSYHVVHWQSIHQRREAITNCNNLHKNVCRVPHTYSVGDLVLIPQDTHGKLAKPTRGPYRLLIDVASQHVNGTVVVDLNHSHKTFNIRQLIPFKPCQNH
jgi:hypothetical protein